MDAKKSNTEKDVTSLEQHIRRIINGVGIEIAEAINWPVSFDSMTREVVAIIPGTTSIARLNRLYTTGLSDEFLVGSNTLNFLEVSFILSDDHLADADLAGGLGEAKDCCSSD